MFCFHNEIEKTQLADGILLQHLGRGENINAVHWDFEDGIELEMQHHPRY